MDNETFERFMDKLTAAYEHPLIEDCSDEIVAFIIALFFAYTEPEDVKDDAKIGECFDMIVNDIETIIDDFNSMENIDDDDENFMCDVMTIAETYADAINIIGTDSTIGELKSKTSEILQNNLNEGLS